jgi:glycosyltransferase involved in cell wall biosynthesis
MRPIRLLAFLEAASITGPAKNLLQFFAMARPRVEPAVGIFQRAGGSHVVADAFAQADAPVFEIPEQGRFDRAVVEGMRRCVRDYAPDVIQTHAVKSHFLARLGGLPATAPWIAFHHGYTWPDLRMRIYNQLDRWSLRAAARVLTVSGPFRDELIRSGVAPGRIKIVHNAIDPGWAISRSPEAVASLRAGLRIAPGRKVVIAVGRLSREKDHETLVRAIGRLRQNAPERAPHLLLVGDGPERGAIERAIAALGVDATLTGQVPSAEMYYSAADLAVLSSQSEGSPNALLEAMAARVPVVTTAVGGVPEIVDGESARLVPPGNPDALASALLEALTNEALARTLAERAYQKILERHSPSARADRLISIYRDILAPRAATEPARGRGAFGARYL